jgi:hypothetical protein
MRYLAKILLVFIGLIALIALSISTSYLLPFPFSKINIIFLVLVIIMMTKDSGLVVWIAFLAHFIIELYSSVPFGLILFSGTISILIIFWFYKNIFTNRSWYSSIALTLIALILYRLLYIFLLFFLNIINVNNFIWESSILFIFGWEILLTSLSTGFVYFILSRFFKIFKSTSIEHGLFRV